MEIRYNAFISYRHHPEDIRVATEIHRALERYRIPKAVRKQLKGNLRLFRDKDELPITSNLSDDITAALAHSDYLIVICSTHTRESIWVQREIETFLKTHTYDKVLTVLVDGEPYDTIPEILQRKEEVDPVTGKVSSVPIEPLSCDWRVGKKLAYREELPRLAAALLHCGYDELRQRQKQYKMRRTMAILGTAMVASLCLMAYFLYTSIVIQKANENLHAANEEIQRANEEIQAANVQIQANLDEALRNQSQYLSSAAWERYEAGDRLTAIALAMAALPTPENPRPYVPDAEMILAEALGLYSNRWDISAQGIMDVGAVIEKFAVSAEGDVVYTFDKNKRVIAWDALTYEKNASVTLPNAQRKMMITGKNLVIQITPASYGEYPSLYCLNPQGQILWSAMDCKDFALLDDRILMVLNAAADGKGAIIRFLDVTTGEQTREDAFIPVETSSVTISRFWEDAFTSENKILLKGGDWNYDYVFAYDLLTDSTAELDPFALWEEEAQSDLTIMKAAVVSGGKLLVMISDGSGNMNGRYNDMEITGPAVATILCYDGETWKLNWRQTVTSYSYSGLRTMVMIPGTELLLCQKDNALAALDINTGEVVSECNTLGNILAVDVIDGQVRGLLDDGGFFLYYYDTGRCTILQFMDDNLTQAEYTGDYFTLMSNSNHITVYRLPPEPTWELMTGLEGAVEWTETWGDRMVVMADQFCMLDLNTNEILWKSDLEVAYDMEPLGFSRNGSRFYIKYRKEVVAVNTANGTTTSMAIPQLVDEQEGSISGFWTYGEDRLHYIIKVNKQLHLSSLDLISGVQTTRLLRQGTEEDGWDFGSKTGVARAAGDVVWVWDDGTLYVCSASGGDFRVLLEELDAYPLCTWHETERLLSVCAGNEVIFFQPQGEELGRLNVGSQTAANVYIHNQELLVISNENRLLRFDDRGMLQAQSKLNVYTSFYSQIVPKNGRPLDIHWNFTDDGELILDVFGIANIIDCGQWGCRGYLLDYDAYNPIQDTFLCYTDDYKRGWFPRYTTEEALAEGKKQLGGYELPQDKKDAYGIS